MFKLYAHLLFIAALVSGGLYMEKPCWEPMPVAAQQTIGLFSHGLFDTGGQAQRYSKTYIHKNKTYTNEHYIFECPVHSFNYPDASTHFPWVKRQYTSLAQDNEIATLKEQYDVVCNAHPDADIILMGMSRGASTAWNFVARHQPTQCAALIIESPFDSVEHVALCTPVVKHEWVPRIFKHYRCDGIRPIDGAHAIPHTIPVLIITSQQDTRVPYECSRALYDALCATGHPHAHFVTLEHGKHAHLLDGRDGNIYMSHVHTFLKMYNLPHNAHYVQN